MSNGNLGVGLSIPVTHPKYADLGASIANALAAGVGFVELPLHWLDVIVGAHVLKPRVAEVAKIVADRPVRTTLHGHLGINLMEEPHLLALHTDVLKANIEVAQAGGAMHLVIHAGFARPLQQAAIERAYDRQREALAAIAPLAEAAGVVVCVECIFTYDRERHHPLPSRLAAELALIDHPFIRATFDFSHGYIHSTLNGADFVAEAQALATCTCRSAGGTFRGSRSQRPAPSPRAWWAISNCSSASGPNCRRRSGWPGRSRSR